MEDSKLFKTLWRINALIIAIAGVLGVIVLLFVLYMLYQDTTRTRHHNEIVNIDPQAEIEERFRLGRMERISGSAAVMLPLYSVQDFSLSYSGNKSTASTRNILFSDLKQEINAWLFPTNQYLIANHQLIREANNWDNRDPVRVILYSVVKQDTNNDQRLTENDQITLALSSPSGESYTELLIGIDDVLGYEMLDNRMLAVIYNRGGLGYIAYIDLEIFKVTSEAELPQVGS